MILVSSALFHTNLLISFIKYLNFHNQIIKLTENFLFFFWKVFLFFIISQYKKIITFLNCNFDHLSVDFVYFIYNLYFSFEH